IDLLQSVDPVLRTFALRKLAEQPDLTPKDFDFFERYMKNDFVEVRRAAVYAVTKCYSIDPQRAYQILEQLYTHADQRLRLAFVEQLPLLMNSDWKQGFEY